MANKSFLGLGVIIFLTFSVLQFNDTTQYGNHDAWIWIFLYGTMAMINLTMFRFKISAQWLFAWAGLTWGALLFRLQDSQGNIHLEWLHPANFWDASGTMVQQTNESGGLLILTIWASATALLSRGHQR